MTQHEKISPNSTRFLAVLRHLTPLQDHAYGAWADDPWARNLANLLGQKATKFGDECLPWADIDLERDLRRIGTPLPESISMSDAIARVANGLCAHYFKSLNSRISDSGRSARVHLEGRAANPKRDLQGVRFSGALTEPWMRTVAGTMVTVANSEPENATQLWPTAQFLRDLSEQGQTLPLLDDLADASPDDPRAKRAVGAAIEAVTSLLEEAEDGWFSRNIEAPMNRRLLGCNDWFSPLLEDDNDIPSDLRNTL